jgi:hypothetical protein
MKTETILPAFSKAFTYRARRFNTTAFSLAFGILYFSDSRLMLENISSKGISPLNLLCPINLQIRYALLTNPSKKLKPVQEEPCLQAYYRRYL